MKRCCETEARKHVRRHRDVAVCDGCGRLVLGYGTEGEWQRTQDELTAHGVSYEAGKLGGLFVVAKDRAPVSAEPDGDADDDDED